MHEIDTVALVALGIPNLRVIFREGKAIGVRGMSLAVARNRRYVEKVKGTGIERVIDHDRSYCRPRAGMPKGGAGMSPLSGG